LNKKDAAALGEAVVRALVDCERHEAFCEADDFENYEDEVLYRRAAGGADYLIDYARERGVDTTGTLAEAKRRLKEEYERRMEEAPGVLRRHADEVARLVAKGADPVRAPFDAPSYPDKNAAEDALHYGPAVLYHLEHGSLEGYDPPA
jgi:hypothetical protein